MDQSRLVNDTQTGRVNVDDLKRLADLCIQDTDFDNGRGDIKVVAKLGHDGTPAFQSFMASSSAMIRACKPWERMLAGPFAEGQSDYPSILDFTEDNSTVLEIVMNVIHLRFDQLPQTVSLKTLAELAILTDKYMLTAVMAPWVKGWIENLFSTVEEEGNESSWLWISWEYGLADIFDQILHRLCMESTSSYQDQTEELLTEENGSVSALNAVILPPNVEEAIIKTRNMVITKILELIYGYFKKLLLEASKHNSKMFSFVIDYDPRSLCRNGKHDCLLLQIGALFCALGSGNLWPEKDPSDVHISPSQLQELFTNFELSDCYNNQIGKSRRIMRDWGDSSEFTCGSFGSILEQMKKVTSETYSITEAQAEHMRTQRRNFPEAWRFNQSSKK
ncbi:hypothetical protein BX600DRAFT_470006 [Xylariales sp. PMI_506]|nr:hypothetical protein BX600DRAFT_470006 [Xylariales sp. PMI_506]